MKQRHMGEDIRRALDAELSGLTVTPSRQQRIFENATGGQKMKHKISVGLIVALALALLSLGALAAALLSAQQVVEEKAVPLAQNNDSDWRVNTKFSPEELAEFIRACGENGIDLDENDQIMQALRQGEGYDEEEAIMAVCRQAFGGTYGQWTIAQRHWFQQVMVQIGFAQSVHEELPGPEDLTEEEARARMIAAIKERYGEELPLEDREAYEVYVEYRADDPDGAAWYMHCSSKGGEIARGYVAALTREGELLTAADITPQIAQPQKNPAEFTLTEAEAVHLAAEGIRSQTGIDAPLEDESKYRVFIHQRGTNSPDAELSWTVNFISKTKDWGFCATTVYDVTHKVLVSQADVSPITADVIVKRYAAAYGPYGEWTQDRWVELGKEAKTLEASTLEGKVIKATDYIPEGEGLITRAQAEKIAFQGVGLRNGEVHCAALIDTQPHPIWKLRLLCWDENFPPSLLTEIDAQTGEVLRVLQFASDNYDVDPSYRIYTLERTWSRLTLAEEGPVYLARNAVVHAFGDMTMDEPDSATPVWDAHLYEDPEIDGSTVRFRGKWSGLPDYLVTLDADGVCVDVQQLEGSGTEPMPEGVGAGENG